MAQAWSYLPSPEAVESQRRYLAFKAVRAKCGHIPNPQFPLNEADESSMEAWVEFPFAVTFTEFCRGEWPLQPVKWLL